MRFFRAKKAPRFERLPEFLDFPAFFDFDRGTFGIKARIYETTVVVVAGCPEVEAGPLDAQRRATCTFG